MLQAVLAGAGAGQNNLDDVSFDQILELSCYHYTNTICGIYFIGLCFLILKGINFYLCLLICLHIFYIYLYK